MSESEGEELAEGGEGEVTLPQDLPGRGNVKSEQSAIKLTEVCLNGMREGLGRVCVCTSAWSKAYTSAG